MAAPAPQPSGPELFDEVSGWLAAGGIFTMMLFPFALPVLLLTVAAVLPFLLVPLAAGLVVAVVAAPILLVRSLWRLARRRLGRRGPGHPGHPRQHQPAGALGAGH